MQRPVDGFVQHLTEVVGEPGRRVAAPACPHAPLVRLRERWPAQQRAPRVPRRLGARARRHRHALRRRTRTSPRASWPSCAPPWSTCARSPTSPAPSGLGDHVMLGRGEESTGGRDKASILADTMEAVIGTVYLSCGMAAAAAPRPPPARPADGRQSPPSAPAWTGRPASRSCPRRPPRASPSTASRKRAPTTRRRSTPSAVVGDEVLGAGTGRSKKEAEQRAAELAWRALTARAAEAPSRGCGSSRRLVDATDGADSADEDAVAGSPS